MKIIYYLEKQDLDAAFNYFKKLKNISDKDAFLAFQRDHQSNKNSTIDQDGHQFSHEVFEIWGNCGFPIKEECEHYGTLCLAMDQELHHYFDEMQTFFDTCMEVLKIIPITPPTTEPINIRLDDISKLIQSASDIETKFDHSDKYICYALVCSQYINNKPTYLTQKQELEICKLLIKAGLANTDDFWIYGATDQSDGTWSVNDASELYRILSGHSRYHTVCIESIEGDDNPLIKIVASCIQQFLREKTPNVRLNNIYIDRLEYGLCLTIYLDNHINLQSLENHFRQSELGVALRSLLSNSYEAADWYAHERASFSCIEFEPPEIDSITNNMLESYDEDRAMSTLADYRLGISAGILFKILLYEGILEEKPRLGSNKLQRYFTPKGRKYGRNDDDEFGHGTPYWYDDKFEELKSQYFTKEKIAKYKEIFKSHKKNQTYRELHTITKSLKNAGVRMSAVKANKILVSAGILETRKRISQSSGELKEYKSLSKLGEKYGENRKTEFSEQTTPYYYSDKFTELVERYLT